MNYGKGRRRRRTQLSDALAGEAVWEIYRQTLGSVPQTYSDPRPAV